MTQGLHVVFPVPLMVLLGRDCCWHACTVQLIIAVFVLHCCSSPSLCYCCYMQASHLRQHARLRACASASSLLRLTSPYLPYIVAVLIAVFLDRAERQQQAARRRRRKHGEKKNLFLWFQLILHNVYMLHQSLHCFQGILVHYMYLL